jgi:hypothetical protein
LGHSRGAHRACAHSRSRCQLARTVVSLPRTPLVAPAALSPRDCSETPLDASLPRTPDVSHQDLFRMRRANAAASKARGAFHRPISPQPLRANAKHHFEQVEPLVASHLAALTRSKRLATLTTGPPFGAHLGHGVSFRRPRRAATTFRRSLRPDYRHAFTAGLPVARPPPVSERQPHAADRLLPTERSTSTPTNTLRLVHRGLPRDPSRAPCDARPGQRLPCDRHCSRVASALASFRQSNHPRSGTSSPFGSSSPRRRPHAAQDLAQPAIASDTSCCRPALHTPGTSLWRDLTEFGLWACAQNESV